MMSQQVMTKRRRYVCRPAEKGRLERIGRGSVFRDVLWTEQQLRRIPLFEFETWAVIALGGMPNKTKIAGSGIHHRIYAIGSATKSNGTDNSQLDCTDDWYPIQVQQMEKVGRPDIDNFGAALLRTRRKKGFFIGFEFSRDAVREINHFFQREQIGIVPLTVREILEQTIAQRLI